MELTDRANLLSSETTTPAPAAYDPDADNCRGGCRRNDPRRVSFIWFQGRHFACPGCFEEIFGGPPLPEQTIITLETSA